MNLTQKLNAKRDVGSRIRPIIANAVVAIGDSDEVFDLLDRLNGKWVRMIYECRDGVRRDIMGRTGVYASAQDGEVQGIGRPMRDAERLNVSFWTPTKGKVNTGAGVGYRTIRCDGILVMVVAQVVLVTEAGRRALQEG
jgi:hypothetical protein